MSERIMEKTMTSSVTIRFKQSGGEWRVVGGGPAKSHSNKVDEGETREFVFLLNQDMINQGYEFDTTDPIWVGAENNGQCPTSFDPSGPISLSGAPSTSQVKVNDANTAREVLRYQLNVIDPNGNPDPIDPIIDNRGGGGGI